MSYSRRTVTDGVTVMNKDLYDNLQDGIDELKTNPVISGSFSMNRKSGTTIGSDSTAEGSNCTASGSSSHAEGESTTASGNASHSEGYLTTASGEYSHAEGSDTTASGLHSHSEGRKTISIGDYGHSEGYLTTASGKSSHAEGRYSSATNTGAHAEGSDTIASGLYSHSEGRKTISIGDYGSHSEGYYTTASGKSSHAEGRYTIASSNNQHVQGKYSVEDTNGTYAHIVGGGTSDSDRKNIHTLDWNGNAMFSGDVIATDKNGNESSLSSINNISNVVLDNFENFKVNSFNVKTKCDYKWDRKSDIPYEFYAGTAVSYKNKIHILGTTTGKNYNKNFYSYNSSKIYTNIGELPYEFSKGSVVTLNNEIHLLGGSSSQTKHYKYNGSEWSEVSTLPYNFYGGTAVVLDGEIHILGTKYNYDSSQYHYKWNGTVWTKVSTLPVSSDNDGIKSIVYNNELHLVLGWYHYKWNGTEWETICKLEYELDYCSDLLIYNGELHLIYSGKNIKSKMYHYKWKTGYSEWTELDDIPYIIDGCTSVVYNDKIHIFGGFYYDSEINIAKNHYVLYYSDSKWHFNIEDEIPYLFDLGNSIVYNDEIYLLGNDITEERFHYEYDVDTDTWKLLSYLPYNFKRGNAVIYNDRINILGGYDSNRQHYAFDGVNWNSVSNLPYNFYYGKSIVYKNEIHILGGYGSTNDSTNQTKHYKYNGSEWSEVSTLPYNFYSGGLVVYNDEINILGSGDSTYEKKHYKLNSSTSTWESVSTLPNSMAFREAIVYNKELYVFDRVNKIDYMRKYNGTSWIEVTSLPQIGTVSTNYKFNNSLAVIIKDIIHILGSQDNGYKTAHFSYGKDLSDLSSSYVKSITFDNNKSINLPAITYGTTDLISGVSELDTGTLYVVYEE